MSWHWSGITYRKFGGEASIRRQALERNHLRPLRGAVLNALEVGNAVVLRASNTYS